MIANVDTTGSADKRYGVGMPRSAHSTENVYAFWSTHIESWFTDLTPTEQFLEYPEKLIFRNGNDGINF